MGFFQGHIDQNSTVVWVYQFAVFYVYSAATDLVFQCFSFMVVGFYACEIFLLNDS